MEVKKIISLLQRLFPPNLAESWDYSGWQKIKGPKVIHKIILTLDIEINVIKTAFENNVDLIIHHHPFLFPKPRYSLKNKTKKKYYHMIKKKTIGLLALHTNFDNSRHGMNYMILQKLKATDIKYYHKSSHIFYGIFPDVNLNQIIAQVKKLFNAKLIQYFGSSSVTFKKIIVIAGAGGSFINKIQYEPHLLFITGEMKWGYRLTAQSKKINTLVIGHHMENIFITIMQQHLQNMNIKIISLPTENKFKFL